jgi:hypothetical protein
MAEVNPGRVGEHVIVTTPAGKRYFGKLRARKYVDASGGLLVSLSDASEYTVSAEKDRQGNVVGMARVYAPIDALLDVCEVETFAMTIVYVPEGPALAEGEKDVSDLGQILASIERGRKELQIQRSGLVLGSVVKP